MKILSGVFKTLVLLVALTLCQPLFADSTNAESGSLKLPAIFGDNMVLQQQQPVPIWGWAAPGAKVTVNFDGQSASTHADKQGRWLVKLKKLDATFLPQTLVVESGETKSFTNILVGEVWLCSGQSNMEKPIGNQPGQKPCFNAPEELAAGHYPDIRLFKVEKELSATPLDNLKKFRTWRACDSNALETTKFSAAGYFFGREIHTNLNVPVGLIESSWGGTRIEPWTPPVGFESVHSLARLATPPSITGKIPNTTPMVIYNAMIAPIAGFAIRGALWYQGESNLMGTNDDYLTYADKMKALVGGWRAIWHEGDFPFRPDCALQILQRKSPARPLPRLVAGILDHPIPRRAHHQKHRHGRHHRSRQRFERHPSARQTGRRPSPGPPRAQKYLRRRRRRVGPRFQAHENRRQQSRSSI